eukprot:6408394-Prymnesium_polylepis.1
MAEGVEYFVRGGILGFTLSALCGLVRACPCLSVPVRACPCLSVLPVAVRTFWGGYCSNPREQRGNTPGLNACGEGA